MSEVTLHCGDCLEYMKSLSDNSIRCVVTDPPYGIEFKSNFAKTERWGRIAGDTPEFDISEYWQEMYRVVSDPGSLYVYCRWDVAYSWSDIILPESQIVIPRGRHSLGDLTNYEVGYEVVLFRRKGRHEIDASELRIPNNSHGDGKKKYPEFKRRINNLWTDISTNVASEKKVHATQKTVESAERMILVSTKRGDTVFDPFMGSGTTGIACMKNGRNFIGCEIDPEYFAIAEKRINDTRIELGMV